MAEKTKAHELAEKQREISVSEFFTKNRHLLGFDNPRKALLMAVKEAVDNSLDAAQEHHVLPEISVEINKINEGRYKLVIEDNGPGIIKEQIPNIFGRLLYGSKFHTRRQNRGQQGIGISAVLLYGQLTTGKGMHITSKVGPKYKAHYFEVHIDTQKNKPIVKQDKIVEWNKDHGTKIEFELEGDYKKGKTSVDEYVKETALVNPHASFFYKDPDGNKIDFPRVINEKPKDPKEIKPHPYGIELGALIRMMHSTKSGTLAGFLQNDFSRISANLASEICKNAKLNPRAKPIVITRDEAENLYNIIQKTKIIAPPTDCLSPIGKEALIAGLKKEFNADFFTAVTRSPVVYRGNPFLVECGIVYGGDLDKEEHVRLMRFANRVPLLYQQGACSITKSIVETSWKNYGLNQSKKSLPIGPVVIVVHMASVWVPFTSESKEAIAHYDEIIKEVKLALQDCGRQMGFYIKKTVRAREQAERINMFEKYIPELADALFKLTGKNKSIIEKDLNKTMKKFLPRIIIESDTTKSDIQKIKDEDNGKEEPFKKFEK